MSFTFQPVSSSLDLPAIVKSLDTYPHYLGKSTAADASVTATAPGPFASLFFTDKSAVGDAATEKVMFSAVVLILQENEWLNPEGSWGKSSKNNPPKQSPPRDVKDSSLKFSCAAVPDNAPADLRPLRSHFPTYVAILDALYKRSCAFFKFTNPKYTGIVSPDKASFNAVHKLLPRKPLGSEDAVGDSASTHSADSEDEDETTKEFSFDGYPACPEWIEGARSLLDERDFVPLRAYDEEGYPISPSKLHTVLPGCIVRLDFHVLAYKIQHQYVRLTTEIGEVQVLARPKPPAVSMLKRKFDQQLSAKRKGKKARTVASPSTSQSTNESKSNSEDPASPAE